MVQTFTGGTENGCRAPLTIVVQTQYAGGASAPVYLAQMYAPLTKAVCVAINNIVGVSNINGDAPAGSGAPSGAGGAFSTSSYREYIYDDTLTFTGGKDFCYQDNGYQTPVYTFIHIFK